MTDNMLAPEQSLQDIQPREVSPVAGILQRLGALFIDIFVLSFALRVILSTNYEALFAIRDTLQYIAAALVWGYFAIGASALTKGQTLGRKILEIRIVDMQGNPPGPLVSLARMISTQAIIFPALFVIGTLDYGILTLHKQLVIIGLVGLGLAWTFSSIVYITLHPRRLSIHDLLTNTIVAVVGREQEAAQSISELSDAEIARARTARIPTILIALIILILFGRILYGQVKNAADSEFNHFEEIKTELDLDSIRLIHQIGPSPEIEKMYQDKQRGLAPEANPLDIRGRKFIYILQSDTTSTSSTLLNDPRYQVIRSKLPGLSKRLSEKYYVDDDGKPYPYEGIQLTFVEILPAYLHVKRRMILDEFIPLADQAATTSLQAPETEEFTP